MVTLLRREEKVMLDRISLMVVTKDGSPIFSKSPSPSDVPLPSYITRKIVTIGASGPIQD
jgi:hypothetical protein